jgi:hypothetical protein
MDIAGAVHHPLFQSVVLPLLLSLVGIGLIRAASGPSRAGAAVGLAVLAATVWFMGWPRQPAGVMQKLPWILALACVVGIALDAFVRNRFLQWLCLGIAWIAASWWLGSGGYPRGIVYGIVGLLVIAWLLRAPPDRADGVAAAVVASLGLAGACFAAGSLALFQLALMLAAALGGMGLWLWPKARIRSGAAVVAVAALAWLALAQAAMLLTPVRSASLVLLAIAFVTAPLLARLWRSSTPLAAPIGVAALAGLLAAGALVLQSGSSQTGGAVRGDGSGDDAYYAK